MSHTTYGEQNRRIDEQNETEAVLAFTSAADERRRVNSSPMVTGITVYIESEREPVIPV